MGCEKNWFRFPGVFLLLVVAFFITTACGKEIRDFFKAIEKYGYKSKEPLSKKSVAVDKQLLGGYVYNSLPVLISSKDNLTYKMTFLAVELDEENVEVEAFVSEINNDRYLNINMGDGYAFLKVGMIINNELPIKLLRNSLETHVKPENLKSWLKKYGDEEEYTPENQPEIDIYYSFVFNKITIEKAYQLQTSQLHEKMVTLFETCTDYYAYEQLEKRYPNEPLLPLAREKIFTRCKSIENYQTFIGKFPYDKLVEKAKNRIQEIKMFEADSVNFSAAAKYNTIAAYESFIDNSGTSVFKDSADVMIRMLANAITENDIEWRWTGSSRTDALQLIYQKIDYSDQPISQQWYQQHLTFYCLKLQQPDLTEKGLSYLDKLAQKNPSKNEMLNLYLSKGFLLWSLDRIELSIDVFHSKINESYSGEQAISFRNKLKLWYKDLKESDVIFQKEKVTWKRIKKL